MTQNGTDYMTKYEKLLAHATSEGLTVKELPLKSSDGRILRNRIAIRKDIETSVEKACVLAEELGHHHTSVGNILEQNDVWNRKQERQARIDGYRRLITLVNLIGAFEYGCRNRYEVAEYIGITEECLQGYLDNCKEKYGTLTVIDDYIIYFIPYLMICKKI